MHDGRKLTQPLHRALLAALVLVGLAHPIGTATGWLFLQSVGIASASSPMPAVFHYPEIAVRMRLDAEGQGGERETIELGPEAFSKLGGPMTRRVPYTFPAFSRLPRRVWTSIYRYGICEGGPIARELGIDFPVRRAQLHMDYRTPIYPEQRTLEIHCLR